MAEPEQLERILASVKGWNDWRKTSHDEVDLSEADLAGRDLSGINLTGANLSDIRLSKANLPHARLRGADLSGSIIEIATFPGPSNSPEPTSLRLIDAVTERARSDLSEINLEAASLADAVVRGANLHKANLSFADLTGTDFTGANLSGAHFHQAIFNETILANVNLGGAAGLPTAIHFGPSTLDFRSLQNSGMLPEAFLRGCGLPEDLIHFLPSFLERPIQFYSAFISYSHEDKAFAQLLHDRLQSQGIRCWLDEHQLLPGDDIYEGIDRGIRLWDKVLLCASRASLTSWWVDSEITRAFRKEAQLMKERGRKILALIPLDLDGFLFSPDYASGKKAEIQSRIASSFVGWEKDPALFDRELQRVIRSLRADDGGREPPPVAKL